MKRWTAISLANEDRRWQFMAAELRRAGVETEYVAYTGPLDAWDSLDALEPFDHVRVSTRLGPYLVKPLKVQSSWITLLGVIDGMNKTPAGWWPMCALHEALGQLLVEHGRDMDNRASVFIAGSGGAARVAAAAFFKAGFSSFIVTNTKENEAQDLIKELRARFFGLNVDWVPPDRIVLLPGESSVFVNCTPVVAENELLKELTYLNFLKRPGWVVDLSRVAVDNVLLQEAKDAELEVINGFTVAARTDVLWARWAFGAELDPAEYEKGLIAATSQA